MTIPFTPGGGIFPDITTEVEDLVNKPNHYQHPCGVETITASEHANFCLGNAIKYVLRHDKKGTPKLDLEKAEYYVKRFMALLDGYPLTQAWLSDAGQIIAQDTLIQIRDWEEERWFGGHPLPEFYTAILYDEWDHALKHVRNLLKLVEAR